MKCFGNSMWGLLDRDGACVCGRFMMMRLVGVALIGQANPVVLVPHAWLHDSLTLLVKKSAAVQDLGDPKGYPCHCLER